MADDSATPLKKVVQIEMASNSKDEGTIERPPLRGHSRHSMHSMDSRRKARGSMKGTVSKSSQKSMRSLDTIPHKLIEVGFCSSTPYEYMGAEAPGAVGFYQEWSTGLCSCMQDTCSCWLACCCYPCFAPWRLWTIFDRMGAMEIPVCGRVDNFISVKYMVALMFLAVAGSPVGLFVFWLLFQALIYRGVIARFQIEESVSASYFKSCCCPCLSLLQASRHMDAYFKERGVQPPEVPIVGHTVAVVKHFRAPSDVLV